MKRVLVLAAVCAASTAHADRYEASIDVHPLGGLAAVADAGTSATVPYGGLAGRLTYGLRHWLALDGELAFAQLATARYDDVMLSIDGGRPMPGSLERRARFGRASVGTTLRLGVAVIPTLYVGFGAQGRWRDDGRMGRYVPDGYDRALSLDLTATARAGLDLRLDRRWIVGVAVGATHAFPIGAPGLDVVEGTASLSYYWYPNW